MKTLRPNWYQLFREEARSKAHMDRDSAQGSENDDSVSGYIQYQKPNKTSSKINKRRIKRKQICYQYLTGA